MNELLSGINADELGADAGQDAAAAFAELKRIKQLAGVLGLKQTDTLDLVLLLTLLELRSLRRELAESGVIKPDPETDSDQH